MPGATPMRGVISHSVPASAPTAAEPALAPPATSTPTRPGPARAERPGELNAMEASMLDFAEGVRETSRLMFLARAGAA